MNDVYKTTGKIRFFMFALMVILFFFTSTVFSVEMQEDYEVIFPAPKSPALNELVMTAEWRIWIPAEVKTLRGVVVHQHGCGEGSCNSGRTGSFDLHWHALARKYDCALIAVSYRQEKHRCEKWCDPRNGSAQSFLKALDHFAKISGHAELTVIPWAIWGHSGGGHWCGSMVQLYPKRVMAAWLRSGHPDCVGMIYDELPMNDDVKNVPVMLNLGAKETNIHGVWDRGWEYFKKIRGKGAKIGLIIDPNTHHETGNSRYPAIRFLDLCMAQRLPTVPGTADLRLMKSGVILPGNEIKDQKHQEFLQQGIWLPTENYVDVWKKYSADNTFEDLTPPPAPYDVKINSKGLMTWKCHADLESGLQTFVIFSDGKKIAKLPTQKSINGRPLFQGMSYSDTPDSSLPKMEYQINNFQQKENHVYSIAAVNSAGLVSPQIIVK